MFLSVKKISARIVEAVVSVNSGESYEIVRHLIVELGARCEARNTTAKSRTRFSTKK